MTAFSTEPGVMSYITGLLRALAIRVLASLFVVAIGCYALLQGSKANSSITLLVGCGLSITGIVLLAAAIRHPARMMLKIVMNRRETILQPEEDISLLMMDLFAGANALEVRLTERGSRVRDQTGWRPAFMLPTSIQRELMDRLKGFAPGGLSSPGTESEIEVFSHGRTIRAKMRVERTKDGVEELVLYSLTGPMQSG